MERPGVGLSVIIFNSNDMKILMGKRKGAHGAGQWAFPGGHIEKFETFEDCAKREVIEETGMRIELIDKYPVAATNDFFKEDDKHYVTLFFRAHNWENQEPKLMEPEKCEEWKWYAWYNFPSNLFTPVYNLREQMFEPFKDFK
ncbi:MAG: NUDIX hydrolase [Candidatus Pacearchaeota archaeon]|jgi:8-oxo-dGTP diphosphatase